MKKLLKSEVCGSVNNAWVHCSRKTWSTTAAGEKKKKKNAERGKHRRVNALSKHSFNKKCSGYNFHKEYIGKSMVRRCSYSLFSHSCWVSIIKFRLLLKNN